MWTPFEIWSVSPCDSPAKVLAIKLGIFSGKKSKLFLRKNGGMSTVIDSAIPAAQVR